jgi:hypothetical protein
MTCCIAVITQNGEVVLVSDKMIGSSTIEGEPMGLLKVEQVHADWWALFSGTVSLAGDLFTRLKAALPQGPLDVLNADAYLSTVMYEKWQADTERRFLRPEGYDTSTFRDEAPQKMPAATYDKVRDARLRYYVDAGVILAGFDGKGTPHILSCYGFDTTDHEAYVPANHDMAGYYAIGSGAGGALWMMSYKDVGPLMSLTDAAYYAVEGKYYGELGQGVGELTDLIIIRPKKKAWLINTREVEKRYVPICEKLRPRKLKKKHRKQLYKVRYVKDYGSEF